MKSSLALATLSIALAATACQRPGAENAGKIPRHLVLVTLDTLRADHVGVYGSDVATPNLDRLAEQGAMARRASTHVPLTRPAHVSLMSGRLPSETGVRDNVSPAVVPDVPLLAEVARDAGFRTAAFVSSVVLSSVSGLDRGFDVYSDDFPADPEDPSFLNTAQKRGDETLDLALAWLREQAAAVGEDGRIFLWLHLYDPHDPYEPPEPYASRYSDRPYAGEVGWTDELVGRLDDALSELGVASETLLVATSDHGEGLGEHGEQLHGFFVYETTLAVPLLLRGPGIGAGTVLEELVGLVDLFPTLIDLLGLVPPSAADGNVASGRSLAAALRGGVELQPAPLYAESLVPLLHFGWSDLRVARDSRWKYIQAPRPELYDLVADPGETRDLLAGDRPGRPPEARALRLALESFLDAERRALETADQSGASGLSEDLLEKLGALGYLGGSAPAETPTPGADPKDKITEFRLANDLMRRGLNRLQEGDPAGAAELFERLLARGIESAEIHLYLGKASASLGGFEKAAGHFEETVSRTPAYAEAWLGLAEAHAGRGDAEAAVQALRRGRDALPGHAELPRREGRQLRRLRRPEEARRAFEAALAASPDDAFSTASLGEILRDLGDLDGAISQLHRATELAPEAAAYWNALGMTLGGSGRLEEAEGAFRRAIELDDTSHRYAYNLGLALVRLGKNAESRPFFEAALKLEPSFEPARRRLAETAGF